MKRMAAISLFVIAGAFGVARAQTGAEGTSVSRAKAGPALSEAQARKQAGAGTEPRALCNDGTVADAGEGACAHNGGIDRAAPVNTFQATRTKPSSFNPKAELQTPGATPTAAPVATPAPASTGATALCRDGTLSFEGHVIDACLDHGGVAEWYQR
jgi:hypothetical protein